MECGERKAEKEGSEFSVTLEPEISFSPKHCVIPPGVSQREESRLSMPDLAGFQNAEPNGSYWEFPFRGEVLSKPKELGMYLRLFVQFRSLQCFPVAGDDL